MMEEVHWMGELKPFGNTYHVIIPKLMKDSLGINVGDKVLIIIRKVEQ